jgi:hypothetical protein
MYRLASAEWFFKTFRTLSTAVSLAPILEQQLPDDELQEWIGPRH